MTALSVLQHISLVIFYVSFISVFNMFDLKRNMSRKNYTLNHFIERVKTYVSEEFNYNIVSVDLKDKE